MKLILKNFLLTFTVFIISCSPAGSSFNPNPIPVIPAEIGVGSGTFIFSFNDIDVEVFYPDGLLLLLASSGLLILFIKVLKDRLNNKEDSYYSKEIDK